MNEPEFTAYEINALKRQKSLPVPRQSYYEKCYDFLMQFEKGEIGKFENLTERQQKWLWGIKSMVREMVK